MPRIFAGHCEDCYTNKPLRLVGEPFVPQGMEAELCRECSERRQRDVLEGKEPAPTGLLLLDPSATWADAPRLLIRFPWGEMRVEVKHISGNPHHLGEHGVGAVRLRFNGKGKWFFGGSFGTSERLALAEARDCLRREYFPSSRIFEVMTATAS